MNPFHFACNPPTQRTHNICLLTSVSKIKSGTLSLAEGLSAGWLGGWLTGWRAGAGCRWPIQIIGKHSHFFRQKCFGEALAEEGCFRRVRLPAGSAS